MIQEDRTQSSGDEWRMEFYKQGSEACRNYSNLTMRVRTLAEQILGVSVVGLAAYLKTGDSAELDDRVILAGGLTLVILAISLGFIDWHYQSAFSAIRDSLAKAEAERKLGGPWRAHLSVRTRLKDHVASYLPFILLGAVGCFVATYALGGIWLRGGFPFLLVLTGTGFLYLCQRAMKRDRGTEEEIKTILAAEAAKGARA